MTSKRRHLNLLRAHRKRSALTQNEVAFLLGGHNGSKVSRYEQLTREPELKTALAFQVIFKKPVSILFPGLFEKIKSAVRERARVLAKRVLQGASKSLLAQKQKSVPELSTKKTSNVTNNKSENECVIGIAPSARGLGFAVMTKKNRLVDWGVKVVKTGKKNEQCLARVAELIETYEPNVIGMENFANKAHKNERIRDLLVEITAMASEEGIHIKNLDRKQMNLTLLQSERGTKYEIATHLAAKYKQELSFRLPKKRRLWQTEAYQTDIFTAVALAQCARN